MAENGNLIRNSVTMGTKHLEREWESLYMGMGENQKTHSCKALVYIQNILANS